MVHYLITYTRGCELGKVVLPAQGPGDTRRALAQWGAGRNLMFITARRASGAEALQAPRTGMR